MKYHRCAVSGHNPYYYSSFTNFFRVFLRACWLIHISRNFVQSMASYSLAIAEFNPNTPWLSILHNYFGHVSCILPQLQPAPNCILCLLPPGVVTCMPYSGSAGGGGKGLVWTGTVRFCVSAHGCSISIHLTSQFGELRS
jgi:hypothetical protein